MSDATAINAMNALPRAVSQTTGTAAGASGAVTPDEEQKLREAALRFEQSFIAQMLKHSGLAESLTASGGKGADAFSTFYIDQLAEKIADQGGFGMAETIYQRLAEYQSRGEGEADNALDPVRV